MSRLRVTLAAGVAVAAALLAASAAEATTFIQPPIVQANGSLTINFGSNDLTGDFTDVFDFEMPAGFSDFVLTSTASDGSQDIVFSSIAFNGLDFSLMTAGVNDFAFLNHVAITTGGPKHLVVKGHVGAGGSYGGVITFTPSPTDPAGGVPEPASWALMISGFAGAGAMLRRTRRATIA